jgi:uncharacterized protein (UPF0332 family)
MTAALQIQEADWIATTAYYARYFSLYALLMKIGVKSEIHDCTINVAKLLSKNGILNPRLIDDVKKAKQTRIDLQYYVEKELAQTDIKNNVEASRKFVLELEQAIENIKPEQINNIRTQLKKAREIASS